MPFLFSKRSDRVKVGEILKETQLKTYGKLIDYKIKHSKEKLTEKDIMELMDHSSYKRGPNGAIRQVR